MSAQQQRNRKQQGYDLTPPACCNCVRLRWQHATPRSIKQRMTVCSVGEFTVFLHSVCDRWEGKNGETRE